jgi:hypothetical protein
MARRRIGDEQSTPLFLGSQGGGFQLGHADLLNPMASMDDPRQRNVTLYRSITRLANLVVPLDGGPLA